MNNVAKSLRARFPEDKLHLLLAKRNSGSFTYDGIELGGERVAAEIEEELEAIKNKGGNITKLSIVGYSLGGLIARYAVGLLFAKGILDSLECMVGRKRCASDQFLLTLYLELYHLCDTPSRRAHAVERLA
jgi:hypothetical protein